MSKAYKPDIAELIKRRNPFFFLSDLAETLRELDDEAKNVLLLYEGNINLPERPEKIRYETPLMMHIRTKTMKELGFNPNVVFEFLEKQNPIKISTVAKLASSGRKTENELHSALVRASNYELDYLFNLEKYRLERMRIVGWSIIKNAYYVMDWSSRVVETASAASDVIQAFSDELNLPAGLNVDLNRLSSLAMDVAGLVQRGMGENITWAYRIRRREEAGYVKEMRIVDENGNLNKFLMLNQTICVNDKGIEVKFMPESIEDDEDKENWFIPIWGIMHTFISNGSLIEWNDEMNQGDIILFLYAAKSRVLSSEFEEYFYECWNRLKMVIKKVSLAMDLLFTKQRVTVQIMKAAPIVEQPVSEIETETPTEHEETE